MTPTPVTVDTGAGGTDADATARCGGGGASRRDIKAAQATEDGQAEQEIAIIAQQHHGHMEPVEAGHPARGNQQWEAGGALGSGDGPNILSASGPIRQAMWSHMFADHTIASASQSAES